MFSTYGYNVKWSNLDPLDVIQLLGNFGRDGHRVQNELESLLKRVRFCRHFYLPGIDLCEAGEWVLQWLVRE